MQSPNHTDSSVATCTDFRGRILKMNTKELKIWLHINSLLKCHEKYAELEVGGSGIVLSNDLTWCSLIGMILASKYPYLRCVKDWLSICSFEFDLWDF